MVDGRVRLHYLAAPERPTLRRPRRIPARAARLLPGARRRTPRAHHREGPRPARPVRSATTRRNAAFRAPPPARNTRPSTLPTVGYQRVGALQEIAHDTFECGTSQLCWGHIGSNARERAARTRSIRGPLTLQMRDQDHTASARRCLKRQFTEPLLVHAEHARDRSDHLGRVHCAYQGQESSGRVREPRDGSGGIRRRFLTDGEGRRTGTEAEGEIAGLETKSQGGRHVVTCSRTHNADCADPLSSHLTGGEDIGKCGLPVERGTHQIQEVERYRDSRGDQ